MAGSVIESAAARYQAEGGVVGRSVNGPRREFVLEVLAHAGDAEDSRDPVGQPHVDAVARAEGAKAEEDRGTLIAVDMAFDDRRPDLARR